jgi:hypothetical protein
MSKELDIIHLVIPALLLAVCAVPVAALQTETQNQGPMPVPYYPPQSYPSDSNDVPPMKDDVKAPPVYMF